MKKIICGALAGILAIGGIVAAATLIEPEKATKADANRVVYGSIDLKYKTSDWRTAAVGGEYIVGDFEDIFECGNMSFGSTVFGKLSIDDTIYTSGSNSLKIEVDGSGKLYADNQEFPRMMFNTEDDATEYSLAMLTDYSEYSTIQFDMYNAQTENCYVFFFINEQQYAKPIKLTNGWNHVSVAMTDSYITEALANNDNKVQAFGFAFDKYQKNSAIQTYYLDNFKIVK